MYLVPGMRYQRRAYRVRRRPRRGKFRKKKRNGQTAKSETADTAQQSKVMPVCSYLVSVTIEPELLFYGWNVPGMNVGAST